MKFSQYQAVVARREQVQLQMKSLSDELKKLEDVRDCQLYKLVPCEVGGVQTKIHALVTYSTKTIEYEFLQLGVKFTLGLSIVGIRINGVNVYPSWVGVDLVKACLDFAKEHFTEIFGEV